MPSVDAAPSIFGRDRALIDGLVKALHRAAIRHGDYTEARETKRGSVFEVAIKGSDTREFRTLDGANKYADRLMRRGRGWPVIIQVGKLLWLSAAGNAAEIVALDVDGPGASMAGPR